MTIEKFMALVIDSRYQEIKVYNVRKETYVFWGRYGEMPKELNSMKVLSIDNLSYSGYYGKNDGTITINY